MHRWSLRGALTLHERGEEVEKGSSVVCWLDFSLCVSVEFKGGPLNTGEEGRRSLEGE